MKKFFLGAIASALITATPAISATYNESSFGYRYELFGTAGKTSLVTQDDLFEHITIGISDPYSDVIAITKNTVKASLREGSIGAGAIANPYGVSGAIPSAQVIFKDLLTFDLTGMTEGSEVDLNIGFKVEADFVEKPSGSAIGTVLASSFATLNVDDSEISRSNVTVQHGGIGNSIGEETHGIHYLENARFENYGEYTLHFELLTGKVNEISLQNQLVVQNGVLALNSAKTNIVTNLNYTSASGVFLTGPAPVPLPASGLLLTGALGGLGLMRRRKKS